MLFQSLDDSFLSQHNQVTIYTTGQELFARMFDEIAAAKESIHIEFYTIYNDQIGNQLRTLLERKAAEGSRSGSFTIPGVRWAFGRVSTTGYGSVVGTLPSFC